MNSGINEIQSTGTWHSKLNLEKRLKGLLRPITPNPEYIQQLKTQLHKVPTIVVENKPRVTGLMMILVSLFSSVFIIWAIRKISKQ